MTVPVASDAERTSGRSCARCGGELRGVRHERSVTCSFCQHVQPNAACLQVGEEVMASGGMQGYVLKRVVACRGPDDLELADTDDEAPARTSRGRLEDVVPVSRAPTTLAAGTAVFFSDVGSWSRTWTASALKRGELKVKHPDSNFQDAFFDRRVSEIDVRVPTRASDRATRSRWDAAVTRFKAHPLSSLFDLVFDGVFGLFTLIFAVVILFVLYSFLRG